MNDSKILDSFGVKEENICGQKVVHFHHWDFLHGDNSRRTSSTAEAKSQNICQEGLSRILLQFLKISTMLSDAERMAKL